MAQAEGHAEVGFRVLVFVLRAKRELELELELELEREMKLELEVELERELELELENGSRVGDREHAAFYLGGREVFIISTYNYEEGWSEG